MILIHTSDLHLVPSNLQGTILENAYYEVLEEISEVVLNEQSRYLLISGDFFDDYRVHYDILIRVSKQLKKLRDNGVRLVVSPGNHDLARNRDGVLDLLSSLGLMYLTMFEEAKGWLILDPLVFDDDEIVFYGVPGFRGSSNKEVEYLKQGTTLFKDSSMYKDYYVVVLAHIQTRFHGYDPSKHSWRYGSLYLEYEDFLRRMPANTRYIALGHLHLPIPYDESFRSKAAYPGAPIGIDLNDFHDTCELVSKGVHRGVLRVDLASDPPLLKTIRLEHAPKAYCTTIQTDSLEDARTQVKKIVKDMELGEYIILVVEVESKRLTASDIARLNYELNKEFRDKRVYVRLSLHGVIEEPEYPLIRVDIEAVSNFSIDELELKVIQEYVSKKKPGLSAEKIQWVINYLGRDLGQLSEKHIRDLLREMGGGD